MKGVAFSGAVLALILSGCVSKVTYEQVASTAQVQLEAHRRTQKKLDRARNELARLESKNQQLASRQDALEAQLVEREGEVSAARLGKVKAHQQREQQTHLVTQLRGELARVGSHLEVYADEKKELRERLEELSKKNEELTKKLVAFKGKCAAGAARSGADEEARPKRAEIEAGEADEESEGDDSAGDPPPLQDGPPEGSQAKGDLSGPASR